VEQKCKNNKEEILIFPKSDRPKDQLETFTYYFSIKMVFEDRGLLIETIYAEQLA
jgi:hypothetical protein